MKIITDKTSLGLTNPEFTKFLKNPVKPTTFSKDEQDLASAALLTAIKETQGLGVSANQLGLNKRICAINVKDTPLVLVNPEIIEFTEDSIIYYESCLSLPRTLDNPVRTVRAYGVKVKADNFTDILTFGTDKREHKTAEELFGDLDLLEAVCVQHEIDHLNGLTIKDRVYNTQVASTAFGKLGRNEKIMMKKGDETVMVKKKKVADYINNGYEII